MTYLWFNPKRVWIYVLGVSDEQPDRYTQIGGFRQDPGKELWDSEELTRIFCNPELYRFMERISQCTLCHRRHLIDDAWELLPRERPYTIGDRQWEYRWEPKVDFTTIRSKSYPPFVVADKCRWCDKKEHEILREREEAQRRMEESDARKKAIFDAWRSVSVDEWCGGIFRCVVCCEARWSEHVPKRYKRYNCCSQTCSELYVAKMQSEKSRLSVENLEDDYVSGLLGGLRIPPLIEAKRLNIKLKRVLKERLKEKHG